MMMDKKPRESQAITRGRWTLKPAALGLALAIVVWPQGSLWALSSPWLDQGESTLRLFSAEPRLDAGGAAVLGIEMKLDPKWKSYWRSPGAAGLPTRIDSSASENLAQHHLLWPPPQRFRTFGFDTLGYENHVILPLLVQAQNAQLPLTTALRVDYAVCDEICLPKTATFSLDLPAYDASAAPASARADDPLPDPDPQQTKDRQALEQALALIPRSGENHGMRLSELRLWGDGQEGTLTAVARAAPGVRLVDPDLFVEGPPGLRVGVPKITRTSLRRAELRLPYKMVPITALAVPSKDTQPLAIDGADNRGDLSGQLVRVTLTDRRGPLVVGSEEQIIARPVAAAQRAHQPWIWLAVLALFGGLILNITPCVLPVVAIKLTALVEAGRADRRHLVGHCLAMSLGTLATFMALATFLTLLKEAGRQVGWGIQFQEPLFVGPLFFIVMLFAASLLGWWQMPILAPARLLAVLTRHATSAVPAGGAHAAPVPASGAAFPHATAVPPAKTPLLRSFFTGCLATLLATPCTAPVVGSLLGIALTGTAVQIFALSALLALGLSAPFLLVALFPWALRLLPKPGAWSRHVRRFFGILLLITAGWLLWVLMQLVATWVAAVAGLLAVGLLLCVRSRRRAVRWLSCAFPVAACVLLIVHSVAPEPAFTLDPPVFSFEGWQSFDLERLASHIQDGGTALVHATADWCLSCKFNEQRVLSTQVVREDLEKRQALRMVADWTRPNENISTYITSFGRYGLPFDILYGPEARGGVLLPEIFSPKDFLTALVAAAGPTLSPSAFMGSEPQ